MKIELAHDFIARKIYEEASIEDKTRARATRLLLERYQHFLTSKNLLLTPQELLFINPYLNEMDLTSAQLDYIKASEKSISDAKFKARLKDAIFIAVICIVVFSSWGLYERQRYSNTFAELVNAQDSINSLRNMQDKESNVNITDGATSSIAIHPNIIDNFSTITIKGAIKNEQDEPVSKALIRVFGAEVFSNENGTFELHLLLAPQHLKEEIQIRVSKPNYVSTSQLIDVDSPKNELQFVLKHG